MYRTKILVLLFGGCAIWIGFIAAVILNILTGGRSGASGGPPNYVLPSVLLGAFLGAFLTGLISLKARKLGDSSFLLLAIAIFASAVLMFGLGGPMAFATRR